MSLFTILLLLFILIPVLEIYLFIQVGSVIGAGTTILIVIGTAILGAYFLRQQGLSTLARAQKSLNHNELPAMELLEGLILFIAGAFLLTPGFFTDTIGFLCLLPSVRKFMVKRLLSHFILIQGGDTVARSHKESRTLEGEYWRDEEE